MSDDTTLPIGPVQVLVLGFAEPNFTGKIVAEFNRLRSLDFIRIVDALVVEKDENGDISALQVSDLTPDEEVWYVADTIPNGSVAAIVVIEHLWAIPLRGAPYEAPALR